MVSGTASAATPSHNTTISTHFNVTTVNSTLQGNATNKTKKVSSKGDPIITGTVTIDEYDDGNYVPVEGATITVNSTGSNSRVLGTTTTDKNGNYYIDFYSNDTQFLITASYLGCDSVTNTVPVTLNTTDGLDYGTSTFQLAPQIATLTGAGPWYVTSNGDFIYMEKDDSNDNYAGAINVEIEGVTYTAFCIDLYTDISIGDSLYVNGPLPGTMGELSKQIDWGKVNYILNNYSPSTDDEAAAMQCAIWYFTTVQYGAYPGNDTNYPGRYQFMTYPEDGVTSDGGTTVQTLAWQMIDAAQSMQYPSNVTLQPKNTRLPNGGTSTLTATVTDSNGNPLSGITVNFTTDKGSLSSTTGITNSNGQVSTTLSGVGDSSSATVTAQVNGQYGTLLYDNPADPLQNLVAMNVLPYTISDSSTVNFDVTANVQLTQTSTSPVNVGDKANYTVTAYNNGPNSATGILINDVVPPGMTNVTVTPSDGTSYVNGVWIIPSLSYLSSATLTISGTVGSSMAGTTTTNTATLTAQNEYNSEPTTTSADIYTKEANVVLSQTGNYSGNTVTFVVTATNNGPDTATNINILDLIPSGLTGVTITPSIGTYNSTTGIWTINSLLNGTFATLDITGIAVPQSIITNNATRTTQTEYNNEPNTIKLSMYVPDVNIAIYNYPWWYNGDTQSQQYTYVVGNAPVLTTDIWNNGPDDATGVVIEYDMGSGLEYQGCSADIGTVTYNSQNNSLTWDLGNIPNGGDVLLKIFVRITQSGTATPNLTTTSKLIHVDQYDSDTTDNTATCALTAPTAADIQVNQTQNTYTGTNGKKYITYTITTTNNGPDTATGVQITDLLPTGTTYNSSTIPTGTTYNPTTGIWNIGTLNNTNNLTLTITAQITATTGTITNTASESNENEYDPNYANNAQTCSYTISGTYTPTSNIAIYNYPWWYNSDTQSQQYTYVVGNAPVLTTDIWNNGPDDATGVVIEYDMGSGLEYEGCSADIGTVTYNSQNNSLTWDLENIPNGGDVLLKIFVRITQSGTATPNLTTTSKLIHVDQYDSDTTDNTATCALTAPTAADIQVNQTQNTTTDNNGNQYVTYTITVTNNGPDTATGVQITDLLPTGTTYNSSTIPTGTTYNPTTGIWNIGTLNNTNNLTLTITAQITATTGTITNTATKTNENEYNPNYANDAQTQTLTLQ